MTTLEKILLGITILSLLMAILVATMSTRGLKKITGQLDTAESENVRLNVVIQDKIIPLLSDARNSINSSTAVLAQIQAERGQDQFLLPSTPVDEVQEERSGDVRISDPVVEKQRNRRKFF